MIQVLLVEDDRLIGEMIRLNLQQQGYRVTWLTEGTGAVEELGSGSYAMALLDVNLPGPSGFDIAKAVRAAGLSLPILMLTARSDTASKVTGLDAGADDYLTKPFDVPELTARVRALLRRAGATEGDEDEAQLRLGRSGVNLRTGVAETLSGPATLAEDERALLELMAHRRGQDLSIHEILEELQTAGASSPDTVETIRDTISRLRVWFEPDAERPRHFRTVQGGYRFEA